MICFVLKELGSSRYFEKASGSKKSRNGKTVPDK
jgi:hypothetical protein